MGADSYRYYFSVVNEWPDRPLAVLRVRGEGEAAKVEEIVKGAVWQPSRRTINYPGRTPGYSEVEVDAETAERAARQWAYIYHHILERSSDRTVAFVRRCAMPVMIERSTCRSGVWEYTDRLKRIERGLDDYRVLPTDAATVEQYLRDLPSPEYRYFAVVTGISDTDFGLTDPAEVLRVRTGDENGSRERLGAGSTWEPFDMVDGVEGLRDLTLLEIDEQAVAALGRRRPSDGAAPRPPDYTYFVLTHGTVREGETPSAEQVERAESVVRQWPAGDGVQEEVLGAGPRWTSANIYGRGTREGDPRAVEVPAATVERLMAPWRYSYYAILPEEPDADEQLAVVRYYNAYRGREEAAVGWPIWHRSCWLRQIKAGQIPYRAEEVDAASVELFLRRAAVDVTEYRYFAILDTGDAIDAPRQMVRGLCRHDGSVSQEETLRPDGSWVRTHTMEEVSRGRGDWHLEPVEVPESLFERYRAKRIASSS